MEILENKSEKFTLNKCFVCKSNSILDYNFINTFQQPTRIIRCDHRCFDLWIHEEIYRYYFIKDKVKIESYCCSENNVNNYTTISSKTSLNIIEGFFKPNLDNLEEWFEKLLKKIKLLILFS